MKLIKLGSIIGLTYGKTNGQKPRSTPGWPDIARESSTSWGTIPSVHPTYDYDHTMQPDHTMRPDYTMRPDHNERPDHNMKPDYKKSPDEHDDNKAKPNANCDGQSYRQWKEAMQRWEYQQQGSFSFNLKFYRPFHRILILENF